MTLTEDQRIMLAIADTPEFRATAGLHPSNPLSYQVIADLLDLPVSAVILIEKQALRKLRYELIRRNTPQQ